jgi:hypothetical protein
MIEGVSALAKTIFISGDGAFEIDGRTYRIPEQFSIREVLSYRTLIAPVPDIPGGTTLTAKQRAATETFLLRRAVACVIPGFRMSVTESLSPTQLQSIGRWIARHRPALSDRRPLHA